MQIRLSVIALLLLMITSCASRPQRMVVIGAMSPAPLLGIAVDENLKVLDLEPGSPAEKADIQRGDILIDLTWVEFKEPGGLPDVGDTFLVSPGGTPVAENTPMAEGTQVPNEERIVTPLPPERIIDKSPIPFTERERVKEPIRHEDVLKLRLKRGDQVVEITIQAAPPASRPNALTATPLWPPNDLF